MFRLLAREHGSATVEAAFGIGSLLAVSSLLTQGVMAALVYIQALGVSTETAAMAAASGRLSVRVAAAEQWALSQLPQSQVLVQPAETEVGVTIVIRLQLLGGAWQPELKASARSPRVDRLGWA